MNDLSDNIISSEAFQLKIIKRQCPGATRAQAETVLVENANNMPKSLKSLKVFILWDSLSYFNHEI